MTPVGKLSDFREDKGVDDVYLSNVGIMAEDKALKKASDTARKEMEEFARLLEEDVRIYSKQTDSDVKSIIASSNKSYIQNPYKIYSDSAKVLFEKAKTIQRNHNELMAMLQASFFLTVTSFEGFVNLIYELYLDKDLSKENNVVDRINRLNIDLKIILAPYFCSCFEKNVIENDEVFKKYRAIINLRNDYVHGNVVEPMRYVVHESDDLHFLINRDHQSQNAYGLPKNVSELKQEDIEFVQRTIEEMIDKIVTSMSPLYRMDFSTYLNKDYVVKVSND